MLTQSFIEETKNEHINYDEYYLHSSLKRIITNYISIREKELGKMKS